MWCDLNFLLAVRVLGHYLKGGVVRRFTAGRGDDGKLRDCVIHLTNVN